MEARYESHPPIMEKQRRFSQEEIHMICEEIKDSLACGVIRPSKSRWVSQFLCIRERDGTKTRRVDWQKMNSLLVIDSGG